jgi:hypothetical protein
MVLARLERHLRTREALIALEGEAVFCVAPPQEGSNGGLAGITAVRFCAGQALILETGAWQWIPFPVGEKAARFLVVLRSGTGRDGLYYHDFAQGLAPTTAGHPNPFWGPGRRREAVDTRWCSRQKCSFRQEKARTISGLRGNISFGPWRTVSPGCRPTISTSTRRIASICPPARGDARCV